MIKFGASGNSTAFFEAGHSNSEESAVWIKDMGLDCFEYSFGRGVNLSDEKAVKIGEAFKKCEIEISVHAPYYINLANPEQENAVKSYFYIIESAKKAKLMGGKRVVFHPASQGKLQREEAVELTKRRIDELTEIIYRENLEDIKFCIETMGRLSQIGTIEEVVYFCLRDKVFYPAVDFGHINAREFGSLKTEKDFVDRIEYIRSELGEKKANEMHVHFSKIEYGLKGELRHLTFEDQKFGPDYIPFIQALKSTKIEPYIVSESAGTQDVDALKMKKAYFSD